MILTLYQFYNNLSALIGQIKDLILSTCTVQLWRKWKFCCSVLEHCSRFQWQTSHDQAVCISSNMADRRVPYTASITVVYTNCRDGGCLWFFVISVGCSSLHEIGHGSFAAIAFEIATRDGILITFNASRPCVSVSASPNMPTQKLVHEFMYFTQFPTMQNMVIRWNIDRYFDFSFDYCQLHSEHFDSCYVRSINTFHRKHSY